jgi:hypothetical protein
MHPIEDLIAVDILKRCMCQVVTDSDSQSRKPAMAPF